MEAGERRGPNGLTPRELAVIRCMAVGASDAEIAALQQRSVHTIKAQVRSILRKLNVRSRHQVADALARLLDADGENSSSSD